MRLTGRPTGPVSEAVFVALGLATFYLLVRTSPGLVPGAFNDDAVYLAVGRALAEGEGYRSIYAVGEPVHARYPPGVPAVYAILWWFGAGVDQVVAAALLLSLLLTSTAAGLVWWLARARLGLGAPISLFFALGPFLLEGSIQYFNLAVSEPYYLALWALVLVLFHLAIRGDRPDPSGRAQPGQGRAALLAMGLGVAVAGAMLFRSQGLVLFPTILIALFLVGQSRRTLVLYSVVAVVPVAVWKLWHARALARGPVGTQPDEQVYGAWTPEGGLAEIPGHLAELLRYQVHSYGSYMPAHLSGFWPAGLALWLAIAALATAGAVRLWRRHPDLAFTSAASVAAILLWPWWQDRFVLTVLPFLGLLVGSEVQRWQGTNPGRRRGLALVLGALALVVGIQQVEIRRTAYSGPGMGVAEGEVPPVMAHLPNNSRYLLAASEWVRENAAPDATLLAPHPAGIWLATGRRVINATPALPDVGPSVWDEPGRFLAERLVHDRPDLVVLGNPAHDVAVDISIVQRTCPEALEFLGITERYARVAFYRVRYEDACLQERILESTRRTSTPG